MDDFIFRSEDGISLVDEWMAGKYSSEAVHQIAAANLGLPSDELFSVFCHDCQTLDVSKSILNSIKKLKHYYHCILATDNMDSFDRFTLPANPQINEVFDEILNLWRLHKLKKSKNGRFFTSSLQKFKCNFADAILIDDNEKTCQLFEKWGGKSFCPKSEVETLSFLGHL